MKLLIFTRTLVISLTLLVSAGTVLADNYTYTTNNNTITITEYIGPDGNIIIPSTINGLPVATIGDSAFEDRTGLTGELIIPSSVTSIERYAFQNCSGFTNNLILPEGVTLIGDRAFDNCDGFTGELIIPGSLSTVGSYAFDDCSGLTGKLVIPASATSIGIHAFHDCSGLTELEILPGVTSIGDSMFLNCNGLTNLIIPASVKTIGSHAFDDCSGLLGELILPAEVTSIGSYAFQHCSGLTGELVIPASVTSIGIFAFDHCSGLTSVTISDGLTSIDASAFRYCSGLTRATIPASVTAIGTGVFQYCSELTSVYFLGNAPSFYPATFPDDSNITIYHLDAATGWPPVPDTWADHPTALWVPDSDHDKIPDWWEKQHFGGETNASPFTVCSNGINTILEAYVAGLDPNEPLDTFQVSIFSENTLQWNTLSGRVYSVYYTTNLTSGFQCIESNIPWTRFSLTNELTSPCIYYKLKVQLEP